MSRSSKARLEWLQIFPDGTCGVAIDGRAVWRSPGTVDLDAPFHVVLEGNSLDTKILIGPVEVWRGMRDDVVDWLAVNVHNAEVLERR